MVDIGESPRPRPGDVDFIIGEREVRTGRWERISPVVRGDRRLDGGLDAARRYLFSLVGWIRRSSSASGIGVLSATAAPRLYAGAADAAAAANDVLPHRYLGPVALVADCS